MPIPGVTFVLGVIVYILGVIVGSFLNVVILRMNTGKGLGGRSQCLSCRAQLKWYELIPVLSFFSQKGKCRTCKSKISWQYPIVEFITGVLFVLSALIPVSFGGSFAMQSIFVILLWIFSSVIMVLAVYDINHKHIPVVPLVLFFLLSLGMRILISEGSVWEIVAGPVVALPFLLLWIVSRGKWIGFGDIEIMAIIGLLLGPALGMTAILFGFWLGAIVGIGIVIHGMCSKTKRSLHNIQIPFAPFLLLGMFVVLFTGWNLFYLL